MPKDSSVIFECGKWRSVNINFALKWIMDGASSFHRIYSFLSYPISSIEMYDSYQSKISGDRKVLFFPQQQIVIEVSSDSEQF